MNYLAHLFLAGPTEADLVGALLGEFVKGPVPAGFGFGLRSGIALHRRIDTFTDEHPQALASRRRFRRPHRRFAGIIVDVVYDHFLAKHWARYSGQSLGAFTGSAYRVLGANLHHFSGRGYRVVAGMVSEDWLGAYRKVESIGPVLEGVAARLRRPSPLPRSIDEVMGCYRQLESDFLCFFPEVAAFARATRCELRAKAPSGHGG